VPDQPSKRQDKKRGVALLIAPFSLQHQAPAEEEVKEAHSYSSLLPSKR
jgi:hypothetical protein